MTLTFTESDHVYKWNGQVVPSVTQILQRAGLSTDYSSVPQKHLQAAARIGSAVHGIVAGYLRDQPPSWSGLAFQYQHEHPRVERAVRGVAAWLSQTQPIVRAFESIHYSQIFGFAGTLDFIAEIEGLIWLIDWKCTSQPNPPAWGLQTGGYEVLWNEANPDRKIDRRGALHIADGNPKLIALNDDTDVGRFLGAAQSITGNGWSDYVYEF